MPGFEPRSLMDRLMSVCIHLLACAIAVYVSVRLVLVVAWPLLVMVGAVVVLSGLLVFLRYRSRGW
jgi:membrane-anchored glycerophosphoryl diester phosphodiesterase (GDPDase)